MYIPCPFSGTLFPTWIINNLIYDSSVVPEDFIPSPYGLMIPLVKMKLNGTTFQCHVPQVPAGTSRRSSIGTLFVLPQVQP